jgi:hypothetical protein
MGYKDANNRIIIYILKNSMKCDIEYLPGYIQPLCGCENVRLLPRISYMVIHVNLPEYDYKKIQNRICIIMNMCLISSLNVKFVF